MRLQLKVGLIFGLTWLLITGFIISHSYYFTLKDYLAIEANDVHDIHLRSHQALQNRKEALSAYASDWARWNDSLEFMKHKYARYLNENLNPPTTFQGFKLNYIIYFDNNKNFYEGRAYNLDEKKFYPLPEELIKQLATYPRLMDHSDVTKLSVGFINYHNKLIMIASYPITNNDLSVPANGNLLMAYDFNKERILSLSNTLRMKIEYISDAELTNNKELFSIYKQLENKDYLAQSDNNSEMYIYSKIDDINNNPIGMFKLTMPRDAYSMGISSMHRFIILSAISGIIILILLEMLLKWTVLDRLFNFQKTLNAITQSNDFTQRVPVTGKDEITDLIRDSNKMLEVINIALVQSFYMIYDIVDKNNQLHKEINARKAAEREITDLNSKMLVASRFAGMADIATSVLHNIGNALNSVNTSATYIDQKISKSELDDLVSLADLIEKHKDNLDDFFVNNPKGKQVADFIIMLAQKGQKNKTRLQNELQDLLRNVDHIKKVINAQQVFNRRVAINEHCQLADLINEALLLCKSKLDNNKISVHLEFENVPSVFIDKIKLLQIFVNLIQNAIEALLLSENEDKRLTIQIQAMNHSQAIIRIIDNGIGIPEENMNKIFTYGFTNKKNGHGFGLHTSALAAKELEGSLNATSMGTNKGAIFTLVLPYKPHDQTGEKDG